jgi:hypothetical protein
MTMPALATLTLVWLGAQKPDAAATLAVQRFARERGATLEEPRREATPDGAADAAALAERCEAWLEQARDQLQAGDEQLATGLLAQLEHALRQHPELLQSSWLMAERYRMQARIARRAAPEQALTFDRLAEVLEGARAPGFGETSNALKPPGAPIQVTLVVHGARRSEIYWDGARSSRDLSTTAGEHHLLVFRGARIGWAGWVSALASGPVDVWVPDAPPCSAEDFEGVALEAATRMTVPSGVRCTAWAAAAPGSAPGTVSIAMCNADRCQPSATLGDPLAAAPLAEARTRDPGFLPTWAAWTLAGVGVAAATSIVLWQAGAFDTAREPKVFYDGSGL